MAFRIEIAAQKRAPAKFRRVALCLAACLAASPVLAQAPATAEPQVPKVSAPCDAPASDIATPTALQFLSDALEKKQPIRVLAIGSSSTVGVGASSPNLNYPNQLSALLQKSFGALELTMVNKGVSGEVAAATADRIKTQVALDKPTLVLWQVGTNDALSRVPVDAFGETVRTTLKWLRSHEIDVVLVGLQYTPNVVKDDHYHAIRDELRRIAEQENVLHVRRFAAMEFLSRVKGSQLLVQDNLHHNDLGYRCMAEHIAHAMVVSSFLRKKARPKLVPQN